MPRSVVSLRRALLAMLVLPMLLLVAPAAEAANHHPRVKFRVSPAHPVAGKRARFDATGTTCFRRGRWAARNCRSYRWTDDGDAKRPLDAPMWRLAKGRTAHYRFRQGPWKVYLWLTVRDRSGRRTRVEKTVKVRGVSGTASAPGTTPSPSPGTAPAPGTTPSPLPSPPAPATAAVTCTVVVSTASAAASAVSAAQPGDAVCLADGTYGDISLGAAKTGYVTLAAQHPGQALVRGQVTIRGSARYLRVQGLDISGPDYGVLVLEGAQHIGILHNFIHDGDYLVEVQDAEPDQPPSSFSIKDVTIQGNKLANPHENAMRASGFDGLTITENEITGCIEDGAHVDAFQAMFGGANLVYSRNYNHDNNCQNFFVWDGTYYDVRHEDNLYIRNDVTAPLPIAQTVQLAEIVDGPDADAFGLVDDHNTSWTPEDNDTVIYEHGPWGPATVTDDVYYRVYGNPGPTGGTARNIYCTRWDGPSSFPPGAGSSKSCSPGFADPAHDDYRLSSGQGVDWSPAQYHYGP